ncbi:MAG: metallophosphoesterase, partial [Sandaracinobacteroides sp.]
MRGLAWLLGIAVAAGLLLFGWGYWGASRTPVVAEGTHRLPGLAAGTRLRVLLLSDTHFGFPDMPRARLEAIVSQANGLKPDLILLAGDYNGGKLFDFAPSPKLEPALEPLAALSAPLGVFAVRGNHDSVRWTRFVLDRQGTPKLLINSSIDVGPVVVAGVDSVAHGANLRATLAGLPAGEKPVLLLRHEGDPLSKAAAPSGGRAFLALAGHTHGGQILLPF